MKYDYALSELEALRDVRYHRTPELCVQTEEQAVDFVNEVGFCFLFGDKGVEIPTLWSAIAGSRRAVPNTHHDADISKTWHWKDSLPARKAIYYGKLLRAKATLVSLDLVPAFYALSPNYGDVEDYLLQYEEGRLSVEAKSVYEALLNQGAMATSRLRQVAGLAGGGTNARRFERALTELQAELKIVKVGTSDANRWGYAYVYDLFLRRFPKVPELARQLSTDQAMDMLLLRHLSNVVAQTESGVQRLFSWDDWEWDRLMARLVDRSVIRRGIRIQDVRGTCIATTSPDGG